MRFLLSSPKLELLLVLMDSLTMLQSLFSWITQCSTAINLKGFLMRSLIIHRCLLHSSEKGAMDETRKLYELNAMLDAEESLMRQKSRVLWLKNGDRKTRTIWAALSERRARKTLRSIKDDNGHMGRLASRLLQFLIFKTSWDRSDLAMWTAIFSLRESLLKISS